MISAAAAPAPARMTAEQLAELPDDGQRHELNEGELRSIPPAGERHGKVAGDVFGLVWTHVRQHQLGRCYAAETGFVLERGPDTVRAPDVAFVATERLQGPAVEQFSSLVPDLVVEVLDGEDVLPGFAVPLSDLFA